MRCKARNTQCGCGHTLLKGENYAPRDCAFPCWIGFLCSGISRKSETVCSNSLNLGRWIEAFSLRRILGKDLLYAVSNRVVEVGGSHDHHGS